jgi:hypothetical protein
VIPGDFQRQLAIIEVVEKIVKFITLNIIGVAIILLLSGVGLSCTPASEEATKQDNSPVSEVEKQKIQDWINENGLNKYGDPEGTFYKGGTPLFNEGTNETIDLYEYILKRHPDRPWLK